MFRTDTVYFFCNALTLSLVSSDCGWVFWDLIKPWFLMTFICLKLVLDFFFGWWNKCRCWKIHNYSSHFLGFCWVQHVLSYVWTYPFFLQLQTLGKFDLCHLTMRLFEILDWIWLQLPRNFQPIFFERKLYMIKDDCIQKQKFKKKITRQKKLIIWKILDPLQSNYYKCLRWEGGVESKY